MQIDGNERCFYLTAEEIEQLQRFLTTAENILDPELTITVTAGKSLLFELFHSSAASAEDGLVIANNGGLRHVDGVIVHVEPVAEANTSTHAA